MSEALRESRYGEGKIIEAAAVFAAAARERKVYVNDEFYELEVKNPYFNVVDWYDWVLREGGVSRERMSEDLMSSMAEDFQGTGGYQMRLAEGTLEGVGYEGRDVVELGMRATEKRKEKGDEYIREWAETIGVEKLKKLVEGLEPGSRVMWTSPPGKRENGYRWQTSITYFGVVSEDERGKRLDTQLYVSPLSMEGHSLLYEMVNGKKAEVESELFFVASPENISGNEHINSPAALFGMVDELVAAGFEHPEADVQTYMSERVFSQCREQIGEASEFMSRVVEEVWTEAGEDLTQEGVVAMELAYTFAYKAIKNYRRRRSVLGVDELMVDWKEEMERRSRGRVEVVVVNEAEERNQRLRQRYGLLGAEAVGGRGCPGGELMEIGDGGAWTAQVPGVLGEVGMSMEVGEERGFPCPKCRQWIPWGSGDRCPNKVGDNDCGYTKRDHAIATGASCD